MPVIASRLIYRQPQPEDVQRLFAIFGDPQTNLFNPAGPMTCRADAQRLLNRWREHWAAHRVGQAVGNYRWPICAMLFSIGDIHTGYMIMFAICALAYLVAWSVMKSLVPRHKEITDL